MIAIQKIGKSFMGALRYNWKKLMLTDKDKRAELLATNFTSLDFKFIEREIRLVCDMRPNLGRYVYHASLNFPNEEQLDNQTLVAIARDYIRASGYTYNQYFVFRHHDSDHPHLHLLVNRIGFDGSVVSDSNNYKRSEAILRDIERKYNLVSVEKSNHRSADQGSDGERYQRTGIYRNGIAKDRDNIITGNHRSTASGERNSKATSYQASDRSAQRAPTKDEMVMASRIGKVGPKVFLQEMIGHLMRKPNITMPDLIRICKEQNIHLLFNQATTGRVSGITYFYGGFKARGQGLGHNHKWAELIKFVNYDPARDNDLIAETNRHTKAIYGDKKDEQVTAINIKTGAALLPEGHMQVERQIDISEDQGFDYQHHGYEVDISDDIDDEAILGRNRRKQKQARTNTR